MKTLEQLRKNVTHFGLAEFCSYASITLHIIYKESFTAGNVCACLIKMPTFLILIRCTKTGAHVMTLCVEEPLFQTSAAQLFFKSRKANE